MLTSLQVQNSLAPNWVLVSAIMSIGLAVAAATAAAEETTLSMRALD